MKLKPCPFCGGEAKIYQNGGMALIECNDCRVNTNLSYGDNATQEAIDAWNKRHNEPPAVDEVPPLDNQRRNGQ